MIKKMMMLFVTVMAAMGAWAAHFEGTELAQGHIFPPSDNLIWFNDAYENERWDGTHLFDEYMSVDGKKYSMVCESYFILLPVRMNLANEKITPVVINGTMRQGSVSVKVYSDREVFNKFKNSTNTHMLGLLDGWVDGRGVSDTRAWIWVSMNPGSEKIRVKCDVSKRPAAGVYSNMTMTEYAKKYGVDFSGIVDASVSTWFEVGIQETGEVFPTRFYCHRLIYDLTSATYNKWMNACELIDARGEDEGVNYASEAIVCPAAWYVSPESAGAVEVVIRSADIRMGMVTGGGVYRSGEKATLKATPNKGYIFDGWYDADGNPFPNDREFRLAQLPYTVGQSDVEVYAKFAKLSGNVTVSAKAEAGQVFAGWYTDDAFVKPYISSDGKDYRTASMSYPVPLYAALFPRFVSTEEDMQISLVCNPEPYYDANSPMSLGVVVDSCSLPTVTAANLPTGLKFDAKTLMISGTPTKPGEGKDVKFTVKNLTNKKGETFIVSIKIGDARAASLPDLKYNDADGYAPFVPGASQDMATVLGASTMDVLAQGGWTVSGLPAGIKFDSKTGKFSGAPTKANENCTVTFKKGTEVATITLRTGDLPPLNITAYLIDDGNDNLAEISGSRAKEFKVTGAGGYAVGKPATLSATAPKGYVFAGWYTDAECTIPAENGTQDYRTSSSYKFTMPEEATSETGARLYAMFIHASHDFAGVEDLSDWGDGITVEINQSESMPADFIKNCVFSGSLPTVTVKGLPSGLKFDAKTLLISGKATDKTPKWYDLIVSVKNVAGYTFTGIFGVSVNGGMPTEDIDDLGISWQLDWLDYLYVGDIIMDESCFGTSSDGVTGVTGLPAEMKLYKETEDGETYFLVAEVNDEMPVIKTPGVYTITINGKVDGKVAKTTKRFVIRDSESIYERVVVANGCEDMGTVTGNGTVVHPGSSFSINATAKKGYVFAGWYADSDCQSRAYFMPEFADYRQASQKAATVSLDTYSDDLDIAIAPTTLNPEIWYAKFVEKVDDDYISIEDVGHQRCPEYYYYQDEFVFDLEDLKQDVEIQLAVESESLPTITFKNLPSWMDKDSHQYLDGFWLWYNWKSQPAPGEYSFTMIAKNASGAVDEKKITIIVPNYTDANHYFEDEYFGYDGNATADGRLNLSVGITNLDDFLPSLRLNSPTAKLAVSGLPPGLKYDAANGKITGIATKEGTYTVTLTVTDGKAKYVSTITIEVEALLDWVVGTFEGCGFDDPDFDGSRNIWTISKQGKVSCKYYCSDGNALIQETEQAPLTTFVDGVFVIQASYEGSDKWGSYRGGGTYYISRSEVNGVEFGVIEGDYWGEEEESNGDYWEWEGKDYGVQNIWSKDTKRDFLPEIYNGAEKEIDLTGWCEKTFDESNYWSEPLYGCSLRLKFGKNGAVTAAFYEPGASKATGMASATLMPYNRYGDTVEALLTISIAPKGRHSITLALYLEIDASRGIVYGDDIEVVKYLMEAE